MHNDCSPNPSTDSPRQIDLREKQTKDGELNHAMTDFLYQIDDLYQIGGRLERNSFPTSFVNFIAQRTP